MTGTDLNNFDRVINTLDSNVLLDAFDKIICFLYSDGSELLFSNILSNMEELLVNIVKDKNNLKSEKLKAASEGISELILNVLEMNKHIFEIICEFDSGMLNMKILIYKKSYFSRSKGGLEQLRSSRSLPTSADQQALHDKYLTDRYILLQKIPKSLRTKVLKTEEFRRYLLEKTTPEEDLKRQAELVKKFKNNLRNEKYAFDELSLVYKKATLQTILDFLENDSRATLVFEDKTILEFTFLTCAVSKSKSRKIIHFLPNDSKSLLDKIAAALARCTHYVLHSVQGKMDRKTKRRDITLKKLPRYPSTKSKSAKGVTPSGQRLLKALSNSSVSENSVDLSDNVEFARSKNKNPKDTSAKDMSQSKDTSSQLRTSCKSRTPDTKERTKDSRTKKLLADMSTPLKSDKAMKMMVSMGWDGGALGLRGEGITEPIIPALGMVQGAGLGHSAPATKAPKAPETQSSKDVQLAIVQHILQFASSEDVEKVIHCDEVLTKKTIRFWSEVIHQANRKCSTGFAGTIKGYLHNISTEMWRVPNVSMVVDFSNDLRRVTIRKIEVTPKTSKAKRKMEKMLVRTPQFAATLKLIVDSLLEFVRSDRVETRLPLPCVLASHHMVHIHQMMISLNTKSDHAILEAHKRVCDEIKKNANGYTLQFSLDGALAYTLKKLKYHNRFINSALSGDKDGNTDASISDDQCKVSCVDDEVTSSTHHTLTDTDDGDGDKSVHGSEENKIDSSHVDDWLRTDGLDDTIVKTENCDIDNEIISEFSDTKSSVCQSEAEKKNQDTESPVNESQSSLDFKVVSIGPNSYPKEVITHANCKELQTRVSDAIDKMAALPLLDCRGVKNGALVYGCRDEASYNFLKHIIDATNDLTIIDDNFEDDNEIYKIAIKLNSFNENVDNLFDRLHLYNSGLVTREWRVLKKVTFNDFLVLTVQIDERSYKYICDSRFLLYAGIDRVQCSLVWDL